MIAALLGTVGLGAVLLVMSTEDTGRSEAATAITAEPIETPTQLSSDSSRVVYDHGNCSYRGPDPLSTPHTNLARFSFQNASDASVLFLVLAVPDPTRLSEFERVPGHLELGRLPAGVSIVERRTVAPGDASVSIFDVENGVHVFLCLEGPSDPQPHRWDLSRSLDFVDDRP